MEKEITFEQGLQQLTELVKKMESGSITLEESVAAYQTGMKLKAWLDQILRDAELKIETVKTDV
ncbi:MAG: exodeoxyribonuclease VII small subunit [Rickettsiales bacterium]|jgi:exodeoxyribonuclease VII small subunit|nr:exodeoxyribonuclease VII small subunit [Rickettsiales bacterium]